MLIFWRDGGLDAALSFSAWTSQHFGVQDIWLTLLSSKHGKFDPFMCICIETHKHTSLSDVSSKTSYHLRNFLMLGDASSFFCSRIYQSSNTTTPSHKNPPPGEGPARSGRSSAAECLAECFGPRQPLASRTFGDSRWPRVVVLSFSCWMPFKMLGGIAMLTMGQPEYHLEPWKDDQPLGQRKFDGLGYGAMFDKPSHTVLRRRLRHHKAMA